MITTKDESKTLSNIDGQKIAMGIDQKSLPHLMNLLSKPYNDPEAAVVREYSTNALDSHVEAGQTRPIEVTTPTALDPKFIVRDFGVGLNRVDIEETFSQYGASTKRETNEQVGSLGIGSKSAFAYTSQFTVVGIKDGIKTIIDVAKDDEGGGVMTVVDEIPTDEGNGVTIMVPVQRHNDFEDKAKALFRYWQPGTVLLNGKEPEHIEGLPLTDSIMLVDKGHYRDQSVVVMGNVPYEIPPEIEPLKGALNNRRVVATVPIGDVSFTPGRESLELSNRTKARLETLNEEASTALAVSIQSDIDAAPDKADALRKATDWRRTFDRQYLHPTAVKALDDLSYQGKPVPKSLQLPKNKNEKGEETRPKLKISDRFASKLSDTTTQQYIEAVTALQSILVTGYTADSFTPSHKKKLVAHCDEHDIDGNMYVMLNGTMPEDVEWFDVPIIKWEDVKLIKLDRTQVNVEGSRKTLLGSYDVHDGGCFTIEKKADELEGDLYYYTPQTYECYGYDSKRKQEQAERAQAELFAKYRPGAMLIRLGLNRIAKFKRDFPNGAEAKPELVKMHAELVKTLGTDGLQALALREAGGTSKLEELDADLVEDPALKRAIELANTDVSAIAEALRAFQNQHLNLTVKNPLANVKAYDLDEHYPLAAHVKAYHYNRRGKDSEKLRWHMIIYLNAAYETEQELENANQ